MLLVVALDHLEVVFTRQMLPSLLSQWDSHSTSNSSSSSRGSTCRPLVWWVASILLPLVLALLAEVEFLGCKQEGLPRCNHQAWCNTNNNNTHHHQTKLVHSHVAALPCRHLALRRPLACPEEASQDLDLCPTQRRRWQAKLRPCQAKRRRTLVPLNSRSHREAFRDQPRNRSKRNHALVFPRTGAPQTRRTRTEGSACHNP